VVAFFMYGRHTGPLTTPLGTVPPTGRSTTNRVTDILTLTDGRISDIWVISDDLGLLQQLDAVRLA
jgi:SnoaL-like polyketide cyclase